MSNTTVPARYGNVPASRVMPVLRGERGEPGIGSGDAIDPADITQDSTHRFATDAEKAAWSGKEAGGAVAAHAAGSGVHSIAGITGLSAALALLAPLASPAFSGTPTVPTATADTNTTQVASTQFVTTAVANGLASLVNTAPGALDTLAELATALGNDPSFATTISTALGNRLRVDAAQSLSAPQQAQGRDNLGLGAVATASSSDGVTEGSTNLYHTTGRVLAATLSGLSLASATAVADGDSIIAALGKLQAQVNAKQATLVSGTNLKSVNGNSLLGAGDVTISGGGTPAGSAGQFQYGDGSAFAAAPLWRTDANTLEQYNGTTAQAHYWHNTRTNSSNYERGFARWVSNVFEIGTESAGTGSARTLKLVGPGSTVLQLSQYAPYWSMNNGAATVTIELGQVNGMSTDPTSGLGTTRHGAALSSPSTGMFFAPGFCGPGSNIVGGTPATVSYVGSSSLSGAGNGSGGAAAFSGGHAFSQGAGGAAYLLGGSGAGTGNGGSVYLRGGVASGSGARGRIMLEALNSAPSDALLANSDVCIYLDQATNKVIMRVKYSDGTLKTAKIGLI